MPKIVLHARHTSAHTLNRNSRPRCQLSVAASRAIPGHASSSSTGLSVDRRNGKTFSERASVLQLKKAAAAFGLTLAKFETQHTNPSRSHSVVQTRHRSKSSRQSKSSINRSSTRNTGGETSANLRSSSSNKQVSSIGKDTEDPCKYSNYPSCDDDDEDDSYDKARQLALLERESDSDDEARSEGHQILPCISSGGMTSWQLDDWLQQEQQWSH